jgi:hypothetical protein
VFELDQTPLRIFRDFEAARFRAPRLAGPANPFGTLERPLLAGDVDVKGALRLVSLTVEPPLPEELRRPTLSVLIRSEDYDEVRIAGKERRLRWLVQWPPPWSALMLVIPLIQLVFGIFQYARPPRPVPPDPVPLAPHPIQRKPSSSCQRFSRLLERIHRLRRAGRISPERETETTP